MIDACLDVPTTKLNELLGNGFRVLTKKKLRSNYEGDDEDSKLYLLRKTIHNSRVVSVIF